MTDPEMAAAYASYLERKAALQPHRDYAARVCRATAGSGMTPVEPLATLGTGGAALLCDHCGRPMVLEGGRHHGQYADEAWKDNPQDGWKSYVLGGMVVVVTDNGTLRVYHGYPDRGAHQKFDCYTKAKAATDKDRVLGTPDVPPDFNNRMFRHLTAAFPALNDREKCDIITGCRDLLYSYDPGVGLNRPEGL